MTTTAPGRIAPGGGDAGRHDDDGDGFDPTTASTHGRFVGTGRLLRLALRRDRARIPIWAASTAGLIGLSAVSIMDLYETAEQRLNYAKISRDNAALIVQAGPGYGLGGVPSHGAILMNEGAVWTYILVAILGLMMTSRHTRLEEETARAELVRSAPVGRHAGAAAGLLAVLVAQLAVAVLVVASILATGYGVVGAFAFGAAMVCVGMAFAAIALVTAQVAATSRAATGMALAVLGVSFVVRAVGDVSAPWLSWLSPIHWGQAIRAYAGERWLVLVVPVVFAAAMLRAATRLNDHRDFGAGMLTQRVGRAEATPRLSTVLALAVRLHRGSVIGWGVGIVSLGCFYGIVADQAEKMLEDNPDMADFLAGMGGGSITDAFLATGLLVTGLLAAGFVVSAVLRMRTEESVGRADPLLATPVSRATWAASHLGVAMGALAVLMAAGGFAEGVGAAIVLRDPSQIGRMTAAGLAMAPAPMVLGAVAFLLCTAAPRWALLSWAAMVLSAAMGLLAEALDLPMWARDLSPFQHIPAMPAADFALLPVVLLVAVAVALAVAGFAALRHRDLGRV